MGPDRADLGCGDGRPQGDAEGPREWRVACGVLPDGKLALTASHDGTAKIWDWRAATAKATLAGHRGSILAASFSPDGKRVLTASTDETAIVWDAETAARGATLAHGRDLRRPRQSRWRARADRLGRSHRPHLECGTGALVATLEAHGGMVNDAQWSPEGNTILTVSADKTGILWDPETARPRFTLRGHLGPVTRAAFSRDGKRAITISEDRTIRIWDVDTGMLLWTQTAHEKSILSLALAPDGRLAATVSADGTARLWTLFPGTLDERIAEVGSLVAQLRPLTKDECKQHDVATLPGADAACGGAGE